ncbi:MAG: hypothetical protein GF334_08170 [Candidatus Altiarchaeales archaeon]|nr:hypothetical protein [Candidatus Altiarchaeales archaeon]
MVQYQVTEIIPTIQGEGLHAGWPCVILRFSGCNLWASPTEPSPVCPWCDTPQMHQGHVMDMEHVVYKVMGYKHSFRNNNNVGLVITGGEPLLQLTDDLLWQLTGMFSWIDIETNGTVLPKFDKYRYEGVVYFSVAPKVRKIVCEPDWIKVLIPDKVDLLEYCNERYPYCPVYVQPVDPLNMDEGSEEAYQSNVDKCVKLVQERGYRLSIQVHKIISLP